MSFVAMSPKTRSSAMRPPSPRCRSSMWPSHWLVFQTLRNTVDWSSRGSSHFQHERRAPDSRNEFARDDRVAACESTPHPSFDVVLQVGEAVRLLPASRRDGRGARRTSRFVGTRSGVDLGGGM